MNEPTTDELEKRRAEQLEIVNEMARRVHTVMCNYAQVLSRKTKDGTVTAEDSQALINGGVSGIAVLVARMAISGNPAVTGDYRPPEEFFADMLKEQFIAVYRETQQLDASQAIGQGEPIN